MQLHLYIYGYSCSLTWLNLINVFISVSLMLISHPVFRAIQ